MADDKGAYGTRHLMEEDMRARGLGVFEGKSRGGAPENKEAAPSLSGMTKAELIRQAALEGVQVEDGDTKAEITSKIEAARK